LLYLRGPTSKRREGKREERGRGGEERSQPQEKYFGLNRSWLVVVALLWDAD